MDALAATGWAQPLPPPSWTPPTIAGPLSFLGHRDGYQATRKARGTYRVVVVGDSMAYGQGVPASKTLGQRCAHHLNVARAGLFVETITLGIPGGCLFSALGRVLSHAGRLEPDALLIAACANDAHMLRPGPPTLDALGASWLAFHPHLATAFAALKTTLTPAEFGRITLLYVDYRVVGGPVRIPEVLMQLAADIGVPFIDGSSVLAGYPVEQIVVSPVDGHLNAFAHDIVGRLLARTLLKDGSLPLVADFDSLEWLEAIQPVATALTEAGVPAAMAAVRALSVLDEKWNDRRNPCRHACEPRYASVRARLIESANRSLAPHVRTAGHQLAWQRRAAGVLSSDAVLPAISAVECPSPTIGLQFTIAVEPGAEKYSYRVSADSIAPAWQEPDLACGVLLRDGNPHIYVTELPYTLLAAVQLQIFVPDLDRWTDRLPFRLSAPHVVMTGRAPFPVRINGRGTRRLPGSITIELSPVSAVEPLTREPTQPNASVPSATMTAIRTPAALDALWTDGEHTEHRATPSLASDAWAAANHRLRQRAPEVELSDHEGDLYDLGALVFALQHAANAGGVQQDLSEIAPWLGARPSGPVLHALGSELLGLLERAVALRVTLHRLDEATSGCEHTTADRIRAYVSRVDYWVLGLTGTLRRLEAAVAPLESCTDADVEWLGACARRVARDLVATAERAVGVLPWDDLLRETTAIRCASRTIRLELTLATEPGTEEWAYRISAESLVPRWHEPDVARGLLIRDGMPHEYVAELPHTLLAAVRLQLVAPGFELRAHGDGPVQLCGAAVSVPGREPFRLPAHARVVQYLPGGITLEYPCLSALEALTR